MSELTDEQTAILDGFKLHPAQREAVERAIDESGEAFWHVAIDCRRISAGLGNTGAALLMFRIKRGDHFAELLARQAAKPKITGWRWTRGSHGETWLRDPEGTDHPPRDYH